GRARLPDRALREASHRAIAPAGRGPPCTRLSGSRRDRGVVFQDAWPASWAADALVNPGGARAVPADVARLKFAQSLAVALRAAVPLDLAGARGVWVGAPGVCLRGDLPRDHDAVRRVAGQDLAPLALAAVHAALVVAAACPWFEHGLGHLGRPDVVAGPPAVESLGKQPERPVGRQRHGNRVPDRLADPSACPPGAHGSSHSL